MKKLLFLGCIITGLFACSKTDKTRTVSNFNKGVEALHFQYDKTYILHFWRTAVNGNVTHDSDRVLFHSNGTVSEIGHRFDSSSYTFPDTFVYTVNASFDYNINWNNIPSAMVLNFYPTADTPRGFLMHDYLNTCVVSLFNTVGNTGDNQLLVTPTLADTTAKIGGYTKAGK